MRERALIHVDGPKSAGKTTLIERILGSSSEMIVAARCHLDGALRRARETAPRAHPELRRYRDAGAAEAAVFAFPKDDIGSDAFFDTRLMENDSQAVLMEGDNPLGFVDLAVFIAPLPVSGGSILVRRRRDRAKEQEHKAAAMENTLHREHGVAESFGPLIGTPVGDLARQRPDLLEDVRAHLLQGLARLRRSPAPRPTEHWAIRDGFGGIERAQVVIANVRTAHERKHAEKLIVDVHRLRQDEAVFDDVIGFRGHRIPVTALVANLADAEDPGTKKAVARIRRTPRARL